MPSNKDRLYLALYARGGAPTTADKEDTDHWALLVGPKIEVGGGQGMLYHARERMKDGDISEWLFEERTTPLIPTKMLLIRVIIGKVENNKRLWVKEALEGLKADGRALGTCVIEWDQVRDGAMTYFQRKKDQHRFDGQGNFDTSKAATYNLMEGKETIL